MKIRDLLVIVFTAIVALLVLARAAHADGSCPTPGEGGSCQGTTNSNGVDPQWDFPVLLVAWKCADSCAHICRDRCVVACHNSKDPDCVASCYPVCASECYDECTGPESTREPIEYVDDPIVLLLDVDAGAPSPP